MLTEIRYPQVLETAWAELDELLQQFPQLSLVLSRRTLGLLILQKDDEIWEILSQKLTASEFEQFELILRNTEKELGEPITEVIGLTRQRIALELESSVLQESGDADHFSLGETLHHWMVNPITGFPLLVVIIYYGIYQFVGVFGAGTLVDLIEGFFEEQINPLVNNWVEAIIPWVAFQDLLAHDYGIITLGIRYATAIVLPIVSTYFLMFSLLEDTGYLPRLSLMLDR